MSIRGPGYECGPDLLDFVIYRPDLLISEIRKELLSEVAPELDKIKKIQAKIKDDFEKCLMSANGVDCLANSTVT